MWNMCEQKAPKLPRNLRLNFRKCSCSRLSLTPLTYLWQRDQAELLSEMIEAGMEAVLIKVAGIGLMPKHLGKTLAEMQPTLIKLVGCFPSDFGPPPDGIVSRMSCMVPTYAAKVENTRL